MSLMLIDGDAATPAKLQGSSLGSLQPGGSFKIQVKQATETHRTLNAYKPDPNFKWI